MFHARPRAAALVALLGAGAILVAVGPASGHKFKAGSKVTINKSKSGPQGAQGRVKSKRAFCKKRRQVSLYKKRARGAGTAGATRREELIGTTRTNKKGGWKVKKPLTAGEYRAEAHRKRQKNQRHDHVCRPSSSPSLRL